MNCGLLKSKVAVVTGSSSGLGCNLCRTLSSKGWIVHGIDINKTPPEMDESLYSHHICDIASFQEIEHLCKEISSSVQYIDLLVNCAGLMPTSLIARLDPLVAEKTYKVNVISPLYISSCLLRS